MERNTAFERLRRIRDEYEAVRFALGETLRALNADIQVRQAGISRNLSLGEFFRARDNVEKTYIVRLFSEFEGVAVHYYRYGLKRRNRNPKIGPVMAVVGAARKIDPGTNINAGEVRSCRNNIIHQALHLPPLDFQTCKSRLGKFLAWLPQVWPDI